MTKRLVKVEEYLNRYVLCNILEDIDAKLVMQTIQKDLDIYPQTVVILQIKRTIDLYIDLFRGVVAGESDRELREFFPETMWITDPVGTSYSGSTPITEKVKTERADI